MSALRKKIIQFAKKQGAIVGFAPVDRWSEYQDVPEAFRPRALWKQAETVIVLGLPVLLPMLETTPSIIYSTQYITANTELDQLAYQLCRLLNGEGHASIFMPRDGYGNISILVDEPAASFSQVYAAKYAGLGTVGYNHTLLTPEYGPRVRFVSVFTSFKAKGSTMIQKNLCNQCMVCVEHCPAKVFSIDKKLEVGLMDKKACALHHVKLKQAYRFPCGVCIKVCPVGEDRKLYDSTDLGKYAADNEGAERQAWKHHQKYGSKPLDDSQIAK